MQNQHNILIRFQHFTTRPRGFVGSAIYGRFNLSACDTKKDEAVYKYTFYLHAISSEFNAVACAGSVQSQSHINVGEPQKVCVFNSDQNK